MPIVKTVSVTYERKLNLGDYNSAAIGCTLWADVLPEENLDQAMKALWEMAKENVKAQAQPLATRTPPGATAVKEFFLGLPLEQAKE